MVVKFNMNSICNLRSSLTPDVIPSVVVSVSVMIRGPEIESL